MPGRLLDRTDELLLEIHECRQRAQALNFSLEDRHYYSYEYVIDDRGSSVAVRAHGDLDCDGVYSTFELRAEVRNGSVRPSESVTFVNELE